MNKKIELLELFGGIGACSKAFDKLGIPYHIADYVEIDKYAVASFNAIHNTNFEPQDICKWNKDIEVDLIMHGSPCQDFSLAGKQAGGDEGTGTRSSLMYETIRIVKRLKPKYVIWENVKNLLSKKHRHNFDAYLETMEQLGYTNYYQVLNAKDYGIPQNRERVFTVSILGNENYEFPKKEELNTKINDVLECNVNDKYYLTDEAVDKIYKERINKNFNIESDESNIYGLYSQQSKRFIQNPQKDVSLSIKANKYDASILIKNNIQQTFTFPPKQKIKLKLKDMLEDEVDEKYYLSDKMIKCISATGTKTFKNNDSKINLDIARPLTSTMAKMHRAGADNYISDVLPKEYDLSIHIKNATKKGYLEATDGDGCYISNIDKKRGTVQKEMIPTLKTSPDIGVVVKEEK